MRWRSDGSESFAGQFHSVVGDGWNLLADWRYALLSPVHCLFHAGDVRYWIVEIHFLTRMGHRRSWRLRRNSDQHRVDFRIVDFELDRGPHTKVFQLKTVGFSSGNVFIYSDLNFLLLIIVSNVFSGMVIRSSLILWRMYSYIRRACYNFEFLIVSWSTANRILWC